MNFKSRLIAFSHDYCNLGQNAFEKTCGIPVGTLSRMNNGISTTTLTKILLAFPDLNVEWLLLGEGKMLKNTPKINDNPTSGTQVQTKGESCSTDTIDSKDKEIAFLRDIVLSQQTIIQSLSQR